MALYSSFLSMAPFILLAVTKGAFGPWGNDDAQWRYTFLADVAMVLCIIAGAFVCLLVLSEVTQPSSTTRWLVLIAGCLSLVLLAFHMSWEVAAQYRTHRRRRVP